MEDLGGKLVYWRDGVVDSEESFDVFFVLLYLTPSPGSHLGGIREVAQPGDILLRQWGSQLGMREDGGYGVGHVKRREQY